MYNIFRAIHRYTGLILMIFILMYFVTGLIMIHPTWMPNPDPVRTIRTERLPPDRPSNPEAFAGWLQARYQFPGKQMAPQTLSGDRLRFRWFHPGENIEALVFAGGDSVRIVHSQEYLRRTIAGLHRVHGFDGRPVYDLWALLLDAASLAMIVFAGTGIYMWYKLTKKRLGGWLLLGAGWGLAVAMICYLMFRL